MLTAREVPNYTEWGINGRNGQINEQESEGERGRERQEEKDRGERDANCRSEEKCSVMNERQVKDLA